MGTSIGKAGPPADHSTGSAPVVGFAVLSACLTAGYGTLFTIVGDFRDSYGIRETTIGWVIGLGFIVAFFAQIGLGPLGDKGHAKALVLGGTLINIVGLLMMGFGTTATVILIGRVLSGLGVGAATPAIKRAVVVGSGEHLGRNLGRLFSADVCGFALGPVISAVLVGPFGLAAPFIVVSAVTFAALVIVFSRPISIPAVEDDGSPRLALDLLRFRPFAGAVMIGSAAFLMIGAFDSLWDVVHTDLDTPDWIANIGIALFAVPLVIMGPIAGKLAQTRGPFLVASIGMFAASLFMGVYGTLASGLAIFAVSMLHACTDGLTFAASGVAVALTAPESRQSGAQGVLGAMQALAAGVMAPITGWLYESQGQRAAYWTAAVIIAAMVAGGLLIAGPDGRRTARVSGTTDS